MASPQSSIILLDPELVASLLERMQRLALAARCTREQRLAADGETGLREIAALIGISAPALLYLLEARASRMRTKTFEGILAALLDLRDEQRDSPWREEVRRIFDLSNSNEEIRRAFGSEARARMLVEQVKLSYEIEIGLQSVIDGFLEAIETSLVFPGEWSTRLKEAARSSAVSAANNAYRHSQAQFLRSVERRRAKKK